MQACGLSFSPMVRNDQHRGRQSPLRLRKIFRGLHGVAFLGIWGIVSTLLDMKEWDVNGSDCMVMTALTWASIKGHEEVVKILLEWGAVNRDQASTEHGQILLSWAAENEHEDIVTMLMERKDIRTAIPDNPNTDLTNLNSQPAPLLAAHHTQPRLLNPQNSISKLADSGLSTQSPQRFQSLSICPLKFCYRRRKSKSHLAALSQSPYSQLTGVL